MTSSCSRCGQRSTVVRDPVRAAMLSLPCAHLVGHVDWVSWTREAAKLPLNVSRQPSAQAQHGVCPNAWTLPFYGEAAGANIIMVQELWPCSRVMCVPTRSAAGEPKVISEQTATSTGPLRNKICMLWCRWPGPRYQRKTHKHGNFL